LGRMLDKPLMPEITGNRNTTTNLYTEVLGKGRWLWWPKMITTSTAPNTKILAGILSGNGFNEGPVRAINIASSIIINPLVVESRELVIHVIDSTLPPRQKEDLVFEIDDLPVETVSIISPDWEGTRRIDVINKNRIQIPREWLETYLLIVIDKYQN